MPRCALALLAVGLVLAFYAELLAHAPATGQDFRLFYAAASVLKHGGNPYDQRQLYGEEVALYRPSTAAQRASLWGNPLPEGPPLVLALVPLTGLTAGAAYKIYAAALGFFAACAVGLLAVIWPACRRAWRAFVLAISPVAFLGIMLGQPDDAFLLALVVALWFCRRRQMGWVGFALLFGLVKPQLIAGPMLLFAVMAWHERKARAYLAGLVAGAGAFVGVSLLFAGPIPTKGWLALLASFGRSTIYSQVDISSLATLYLGWAPHGLAVMMSLTMLIAWAGVGIAAWTRGGMSDQRRWLVTMLSLWMLVTPYAHPHDDVLLLPCAWFLLESGPYRGRLRLLAAALFAAWWLLPMTSVLGVRPPAVRGLGIVPVLLLAALLLLLRPAPSRRNLPIRSRPDFAQLARANSVE